MDTTALQCKALGRVEAACNVSCLTGKKLRELNLTELHYTAPSGTHESVAFQIAQGRFMLEQMQRFERDFQTAADKGNRRMAFKARDKYIFHFLVFLSATRIAIYYMIAAVKHDRDSKAWFMARTSTIVFKVFREVRGFATHEQPLRFSLNYNITWLRRAGHARITSIAN